MHEHDMTSLEQKKPVYINPIVQPVEVNQQPTAYTVVQPVSAVPQPNQYVSSLNPIYVDHLSRHKGEHIIVTTTAGKVEGKLTGIATDHIQLTVAEKRALHIRIEQIVFFEGFPISYK